jgi:dihydroneopterin aldolase
MTDSIKLRGIEVFAHHGVLAEEQDRGQVFLVDVDVALDLSEAAASDDLSTTLHYGELAQVIHDRVQGERWDLIEKVAGRVADLVLEDERVLRVDVTVHKPHAPIEVPFSDVSVTISRIR